MSKNLSNASLLASSVHHHKAETHKSKHLDYLVELVTLLHVTLKKFVVAIHKCERPNDNRWFY